jgi:hypothetical protein
MNRGRSFRIGAFGVVATVAAALISCDSGPKAGDITATLSTYEAELGSVMFAVTAVEPNTIEGLTAVCSGCKAFMSRVSQSEVRGIVTGPFGPGALVHVTVSNRRTPEAYSIRILEMAGPDYSITGRLGSSLQFPTK